MASSSADTTGQSAPAQSPASSLPLDTIMLHVLSPSPEVNGGRITFPSIPLDTKISHLKSRIQNSLIVPTQPERQRLIYRGRPLLNMDATLRQVLQPELSASTDENPSYTLHMVITPAAGSMPPAPTPTFRQTPAQHRSTPPPGAQAQAPPNIPHHHHQHQPHFHPPTHPAMTQTQAAQAMLQNQLSQLQQQIAMTSLMAHGLGGHGHGPGHGPGHIHNQPPQMPSFPSALPNMQAFQAAIMQQQQMRAHAGMHGIHNPGMNGTVPSVAPGQNNQGLGPITTRVHETVGPDGQRTRVVVNETTFQISRQSTPVPGASRPEVPRASQPQNQSLNPSGLQQSSGESQSRRQHEPLPLSPEPLPFPHLPALLHTPHIPNFGPQSVAYQPTVPDLNRNTASTTTTAWLLSSPSGPQALVFAPGHGFFTSASPPTLPSIRAPGPRTGLRFQQTPGGRIRPPNAPNIPVPPALDPAVANAQPQQALEAIVRARNAAAAAQQANAEVNANNEVLRAILSRVWTFIKLYFIIFMFTEPGSWFRWLCLFVAVLVSAMPSTTVFRGFQARLQAQIDGLVPPPPPVPAQQPRQQQIEGPAGGSATALAANTAAPGRQPEPDPAVTAARLVREHRQQHPNVLRDTFERVERALGLFVASLIPGVGERQVRAREEARREIERLERERIAAEEEAKKRAEEEKEKKKQEGENVMGDGVGEVGESSKVATEQGESQAKDEQGKEEAVRERPLIEI